MQPRASRMVTTSGFSFFSTPFASAASRILRATSRVSSAIYLFLCTGGLFGFGSCVVEAHGQHAGEVDRFPRGAVLDLMPARGAVGYDQRGVVGAANRRQQRQFGHVDRGLIGVGTIAEGAS